MRGETLAKIDVALDDFEKQIRIDISNHISGDGSRNAAFSHIDARKALYKLCLGERLDEHKEWVLPTVTASHAYEQDENGSGIQYFDNERLARYHELQALIDGDNKVKENKHE